MSPFLERFPPFAPHPLLANPHAMTLVAAFLPRRPRHVGRATERRWFRVAPDTTVLGLCDWQDDRRVAPTLVLLHGLTGSADALAMIGTADKAVARGFNCVRLNLRNCGGTHHLTPTLYHCGLTSDLLAVLTELKVEDGLRDVFAAGFSLGGNIALKLAGELGPGAGELLAGVATVSAPLDLKACSDAIASGGLHRVYERYFVQNLIATVKAKREHFPDRFAEPDPGIHTLREFDEAYTAPQFHFLDALDYYERTSAGRFLPRIEVPALLVSAQDDVLVPADSYRAVFDRDLPGLKVLFPEHGGHLGFVGAAPGRAEGIVDADLFWAENRVLQFCAEVQARRERGRRSLRAARPA